MKVLLYPVRSFHFLSCKVTSVKFTGFSFDEIDRHGEASMKLTGTD
jgi:hypothetical protein